MKHLGDITKISGYTAPIVDCIIGGSPCQDLSVAGKRAGLEGERSGLFMEQIRIVKEMRLQDERNGRTDVNIRPRYMVWENVPGAFSSNKGEDFRVVLEEIARVKDKNASVPLPDKGKWTTAGCIVGIGWSIAWRVLDAQFWRVPQRRRRIALVADFGGQSASEILFVRSCVSGHSDESQPKRKDSTTDATGSTGANDCYCYDIGEARLRTPSEYKDLAPTLTQRCGTGGNNVPAVVETAYTMQDRERCAGFCHEQSAKTRSIGYEEEMSPTLRNNVVPAVVTELAYTLKIRSGCEGGGKGALVQTDKSATIATNNDQYLFQPVKTFDARGNGNGQTVPTLIGDHEMRVTDFTAFVVKEDKPVYALDRASFNQGKNAQYDFEISDKGINSPLVAKGPGAVCFAVDCRNGTESEVNGALQSNSAHSLNGNNTVRTRYIVRRLTPLECERLQGYPDGWTDIGEYTDSNGKRRQTSDASRYKALGNSIALPPWKWVLKRICACYERDATMASLFDGIGGFPYLREQLNGKGTCLWASEIEEFPMAVTKVRIGE